MASNAAFLIVSLLPIFPLTVYSCQIITCPCGKTGENVTVCAAKVDNACSRLSGCKSCRNEMKTCWECPEGFEGPFCEQAIQDRDFSRQKRQASRQTPRRRRPVGRRGGRIEGRYRYAGREITCDNPGYISLGQTILDPLSVPPDVSSDRQELPSGARLQYFCNSGYALRGANSVTCTEDGYWSANPPTCIKASRSSSPCSAPMPISNGRVLPAFPAGPRLRYGGYPVGSRLEYACDEGYILTGSNTVTCQPSGFWSGLKPTCETDCGRVERITDGRVFNGTVTYIGDWPWVVAIKLNNKVICAGALLNPTTVLTAAHCLTRASNGYKLYFGKLHLADSQDDIEVKVRNSTGIALHPHFNTDLTKTNFDSDIGLIFFSPKIRYTKRIQPICLPSSETTINNLVFGRTGNVAAWGLNEMALQSDLLMLAKIGVRTNKECMETYNRLLEKPLELTLNQFCAGNEDGQQDMCESDSGAPMVFKDPQTERYTVEGLVSFRIGQCGMKGRYTVFTNVYQFVVWIRCRMSKRECPIV